MLSRLIVPSPLPSSSSFILTASPILRICSWRDNFYLEFCSSCPPHVGGTHIPNLEGLSTGTENFESGLITLIPMIIMASYSVNWDVVAELSGDFQGVVVYEQSCIVGLVYTQDATR